MSVQNSGTPCRAIFYQSDGFLIVGMRKSFDNDKIPNRSIITYIEYNFHHTGFYFCCRWSTDIAFKVLLEFRHTHYRERILTQLVIYISSSVLSFRDAMNQPVVPVELAEISSTVIVISIPVSRFLAAFIAAFFRNLSISMPSDTLAFTIDDLLTS